MFAQSLFAVLMLISPAVLAQDDYDSYLGVCIIYEAAYPEGHISSDLSTPILPKLDLPQDVLDRFEDLGQSDLTTEEFLVVYEPQEELCKTNQEAWTPVVAEVKSGDLSEASIEILELSLLEITVYLQRVERERRRLDAGEDFLNALAVAATVLMWSSLIFMSLWMLGCRRRRRALVAPQKGLRLLKSLGGAARRALSEVEIPTMDIINACSHGIPSFVCGMTTLALTQSLSSEACGGSANIQSCVVNEEYVMELFTDVVPSL